MNCLSKTCTNVVWPESVFCDSCLTGLCCGELRVDDLVDGLKNSSQPVWSKVTEERKKNDLRID